MSPPSYRSAGLLPSRARFRFTRQRHGNSKSQAADYDAAQQRITAVNWPWYDFRAKMGKRTGAESPVVKAALELCGRPGGPSCLPNRSLNEEEREELRQLLARIGVPDLK